MPPLRRWPRAPCATMMTWDQGHRGSAGGWVRPAMAWGLRHRAAPCSPSPGRPPRARRGGELAALLASDSQLSASSIPLTAHHHEHVNWLAGDISPAATALPRAYKRPTMAAGAPRQARRLDLQLRHAVVPPWLPRSPLPLKSRRRRRALLIPPLAHLAPQGTPPVELPFLSLAERSTPLSLSLSLLPLSSLFCHLLHVGACGRELGGQQELDTSPCGSRTSIAPPFPSPSIGLVYVKQREGGGESTDRCFCP